MSTCAARWVGFGLFLALAACGGGNGDSGGGAAAVRMSSPRVLEGDVGTTRLVFTVSAGLPIRQPIVVRYATASTAKPGGGGTGSAKGGAACGAGVNYLHAQGEVVLEPGENAQVAVTVCANTVFEPNNTLALVWSVAGQSGQALGTIVNDDPGGLNGTGAAEGFGRDSDPLTNSDVDGRLGFSFTKLPNEANWLCTRDNVTGLVWLGQIVPRFAEYPVPEVMTFADAQWGLLIDRDASACGLDRWHLPSVAELQTLWDSGALEPPLIDTRWFPGQRPAPYWTSTISSNPAPNIRMRWAWIVDFDTGASHATYYDHPDVKQHVRLVAGGLRSDVPAATGCTNQPRYVDHGDGTVTDQLAGLMWKKCAEGLQGASCDQAGSDPVSTWGDALARPGVVNADPAGKGLGYADWRLPTRSELSSLADRSLCYAPAIDHATFPHTEGAYFWSSTPVRSDPGARWTVEFREGSVAARPVSGAPFGEARVRLVRAGQ